MRFSKIYEKNRKRLPKDRGVTPESTQSKPTATPSPQPPPLFKLRYSNSQASQRMLSVIRRAGFASYAGVSDHAYRLALPHAMLA